MEVMTKCPSCGMLCMQKDLFIIVAPNETVNKEQDLPLIPKIFNLLTKKNSIICKVCVEKKNKEVSGS
jgi:hypothetical protein